MSFSVHWPSNSIPFSSVDSYKKLVFRQAAQQAWLMLLWFWLNLILSCTFASLWTLRVFSVRSAKKGTFYFYKQVSSSSSLSHKVDDWQGVTRRSVPALAGWSPALINLETWWSNIHDTDSSMLMDAHGLMKPSSFALCWMSLLPSRTFRNLKNLKLRICWFKMSKCPRVKCERQIHPRIKAIVLKSVDFGLPGLLLWQHVNGEGEAGVHLVTL